MDENEAGGARYGGDQNERFRRDEAISAVVDEGFLGEEDEDYEDLYNDVNVGENFLQSMRKNGDDLGHRNGGAGENQAKVTPPPPQPPVVESGGVGLQDEVASSRFPGRVEGYQNVGFRGNNNGSDVGVGRGVGAPRGAAGGGGGGGLRMELGQSSHRVANLEDRTVGNSVSNIPQMVQHQPPHPANTGGLENVGHAGNMNGTGGNAYGGAGAGAGVGGTILYVGDLHWWTTDAELESELCKYGQVKEVKFFDERASGKSKGYCQVEFYDPIAATACKEGMNGHMFNGRPCVVAYASPFTVKRMGEAQFNRNQQQMGQSAANQPRRGPGDLPSKPAGNSGNIATGGNNQGGFDNNGRGFGRGNWGRGNNTQGGMGNMGAMCPMSGRAGGMGIRGFSGNGNGFGQGMGAAPPLMHPQNMMGQGFDPSFGGPMGRMGGYGGLSGTPTPPFPGMLPSFGPGMGNVGLPGVAPHVNPAFFGRGMPMNGMGMMHTPGVEGPNMGMWGPDPNIGVWAGGDHGTRTRESSYGEEAASDHQYGEGSQERRQLPNSMKEKDRESGSSERKYRDERGEGYDRYASREKDIGRGHDWSEKRLRDERDGGRERERDRDRERHRHDRDRYNEHHKYRSREAEYDDERDKGRSSRTPGKSRLSHEEDHRSRSRDADYGKRRRLTSD